MPEVARYLGVPVATLYQWRHHGYGPAGRRVGRYVRYVRYDPDEVRRWFAGQGDGAAERWLASTTTGTSSRPVYIDWACLR